MARWGICYLPKWVVIHSPRLFLLYWILVTFTWAVALWRFVELEQYSIKSPVNGIVSMLPFASGLSRAEAAAAMQADREKAFCMTPAQFEYTYSNPSNNMSKSFNYTNIKCTYLCDASGGTGESCVNEAEMKLKSATGTFVPTFFSDMTMSGSTSTISHYFVPGMSAVQLAFSHDYWVHRPADLVGGARPLLSFCPGCSLLT
ncbi:unnamed protein product [Effrenium voratum]|nr:unnamed protein product [Effrenium voratum]